MLYKKAELSVTDLQQIQGFIIIWGIFIPPRRSLDYVKLMIKDADKEKGNYDRGESDFIVKYEQRVLSKKEKIK